MQPETIFMLLFIVATAVAIAVRRVAVPYTVALVLAGLVLGLVHAFEAPHLTKALLFSVFLPGLLFEAAFHIEFKQFWRNRFAITSLALPGVVAAIVLTAIVLTPVANTLHFVQDFTWKHALVFGALISATDPIAVVAIFRNLGVPKRLAVLLDGESLLNDGTAIVFFTLSLALVTGTEVTAGGLAWDFVRIVGMGALVGTGVGLGASQIIKQVDDPMIEISLTTIAAYGSFLAAEHFHYSGVIATVSAGMFCGNYAARVGMSPSTRVAVEAFWEYVAFALNSIVFLLIGLEVQFRLLLASWQAILVAYLIVTIGQGPDYLRRILAVAKDAGTDSLGVERGPDLGRVAWRLADGARAQFAGCFPAPRSAGFDDLWGRYSFDPRPWADDVAASALVGDCAGTGGPHRVRVYARQVTGSPRRIAGA